MGAIAVAFTTAVVGWGILLFGLYAEADTGLPDGLACTGRITESVQAYENCMSQEESRTMIAWGLTGGLAALGVAMMIGSRRVPRSDASQRVATAFAVVASLSLAAAAAVVWAHGAGGGFYNDAFGPGRWHLTMGLGVAVGAVAGWVLSVRLARVGPPTGGPTSPADRGKG